METTKSAVIYSFREENGFGVLELEDGSELLFDVTACVEEPLEGQSVRVVLGRSRQGQPRAVLVEPATQPESTRPVRTLREALKRLQSEGIALELGEFELAQIVAGAALDGELPAELGTLLEVYYRDEHFGDRRRQMDLYASFDRECSVDEVVAELVPFMGGEAVTFAVPAHEVLSLDGVVDAFNEELRSAGDARRIVPLESTGQKHGYFLMALARATRLSALGVLRVRWNRPHLTPSEPPLRNA